MKTLAVLLFALLSLYLLPTSSAQDKFNPIRLRTANEAAALSDDYTPVTDTDGNEVQPGIKYHVVSAISVAGGAGLRLVHMDSTSKCASDVIISPSDLDVGDPITFMPADQDAFLVMPSTFLGLKFNVATNKLCVNNVNWGIQYDRKSGQYLVKAGEFVPRQSNLFRIEVVNRDLNAYKLTYCPSGTDECSNVGRYYDRKLRTTRLALRDDSPFVFSIQTGNK